MPRYGPSDVGLVKICKKLGIPVPPRGYWAKVKAGRPHPQGAVAHPPAGTRVRDTLQHTRETQSTVSVPDELVHQLLGDRDLPALETLSCVDKDETPPVDLHRHEPHPRQGQNQPQIIH